MTQTNTTEIPSKEKLLEEAKSQSKGKVPEKMMPIVENALEKIFNEGKLPYQAMNISKDMIENIYEQAYFLFKSGKFKDALALFTTLSNMVGGTDSRFIFAIAAANHHLKKYTEAAGYYMFYELMHPKDPLPYYHMYDCFMKTDSPLLAECALEAAKKLASANPKYADLKAKAEIELRHFQTKKEEKK